VISVDTSVVVRHLVGTPETLARRATAVIERVGVVDIPVLVLLETAHVLRTQYDVPRLDVLEVLIGLVTRDNVELIGLPKTAVLAALARARSLPGAPLPDALIVASAQTADALPLYSFDTGLGRHGILVVEP
jgi:predicted nucleic acid-binding protein